jgi:hypothetical protein
MKHDIVRQVGYIQQSLSQNKRPTGFFIGAGCPLSIRVPKPDAVGGDNSTIPLIPDVAGLTSAISKKLKDDGKAIVWNKLIKIVNEDGGNVSNIEHLLSQVRQLKSVVGKGEIRGLSADELKNIDYEICSIISDLVNKELPNTQTPYHNLAVWVRSIRRDNPVHIFTTNYDLLMEQALEESSTPYFDGFVGSRKAFFDLGAVEDESILPARWARLWKVHGSLNWRLNKDGRTVVRSSENNVEQSHLIYPSHLKYDQSRKMPYLAMLDRLKEFLLKQNSILFISGYSFGDEHINDVICRTLEANSTAHVFALLYGKLDDPKYAEAKRCGLSSPNLSVIAFDKGVVGRLEGDWKGSGDDSPFNLPDGVIVSSDDEHSELKLGDFAQFGLLIRHLTGERMDDAK